MRGQNIGTFHKLGISFASLPAWFGVACLLLAATAVSSATDTFTTRVNFNGINGSTPYLEFLVQGTDGNLYGTTATGGSLGLGTVFKVTPTGTLTTIYNFSGTPDGATPKSGLVLGNTGNFFWGTTTFGGTFGFGTVFKITSVGTLTILYSFGGTDGEYPTAGLVEGTEGSFYGTTNEGGAFGLGTVFKITSAGVFTILHSFAGGAFDGEYPLAGLVEGTDGSFYGTAQFGGTSNLGTVFKITSVGVFTILHSFAGGAFDGEYPIAGLIQAADGKFYGTAYKGGTSNLGTIFEMNSGGTLTTLHSFAGGAFDGEYPYAALFQATNRKFYGTAYEGGTSGLGTVFKFSGGTLTTLHSFAGADGELPAGGLVQRTSGGFFGVTSAGGSGGQGTVFSLNEGLGAFVKTLPTSGAVGTAVTILGTNLTGATGVFFNGTLASFAVVSSSEIATFVPTGATTGPVVVTTPGGNLTSNVNFVVP